MKKLYFLLIYLLFLCFLLPFNATIVKSESCDITNTVKLFPSSITHCFTHALIADPEKAFDIKNQMRVNYDRDCLTVKEFKAILQSLYDNNYALMDIRMSLQNGKLCSFSFPENKKPLVLSFDDINYYVKKMNLGMNDKLILSNNKIATILKGKIEYDNEVITVLENFIETHPDFSYNGAKGIICLTGFDGILGYRTQRDSDIKEREIVTAKKVVNTLKNKGWQFACHSYGHYHMKKLTDERFILDTTRWINEVQPIVGKTDLYAYPYGENEILNNEKTISNKQAFLQSKGFNMFFGVGIKPYYSYYPCTNKSTIIMDRIPLDGYALRNCKEKLIKYFDSEKVFDYEARPTY